MKGSVVCMALNSDEKREASAGEMSESDKEQDKEQDKESDNKSDNKSGDKQKKNDKKQSGKDNKKSDKSGGKGSGSNAGSMSKSLKNTLKLAAAQGLASGLGMLLMLNLLKLIIKQLAQMLLAMLQGIAAMINAGLAMLEAAIGFILGLGPAIMSVATAAVVSVAVAIMGALGMWSVATRDYYLDDECVEKAYAHVDSMTTSALDKSDKDDAWWAAYKLNTRKVYSVLADYGISDLRIAAILANFDADSMMNPAAVDGIFIDTDASDDYTSVVLTAEAFNFESDKVYTDANITLHDIYKNMRYGWRTGDDVKFVGIGYGKWSGNLNRKLVNYAKAIGKNWYETETQLMFMLSGNAVDENDANYKLVELLNRWKNETEEVQNVETAVEEYYNAIISNPSMSRWSGSYLAVDLDTRKAQADNMARLIAGYTITDDAGNYQVDTVTGQNLVEPGYGIDSIYADSLIAMASTAIVDAEDTGTARSKNQCSPNSDLRSNVTIGSSATVLAWNSINDANNDGTMLYKRVHDVCIGDKTAYKGADKMLSTVVRWSGADDDFPVSGLTGQLVYLSMSSMFYEDDLWDGTEATLQNGDILISDDTAAIYVGNDGMTGISHIKTTDSPFTLITSDDSHSVYCAAFDSNKYKNCRVFRSFVKEMKSLYRDAAYQRVDRITASVVSGDLRVLNVRAPIESVTVEHPDVCTVVSDKNYNKGNVALLFHDVRIGQSGDADIFTDDIPVKIKKRDGETITLSYNVSHGVNSYVVSNSSDEKLLKGSMSHVDYSSGGPGGYLPIEAVSVFGASNTWQILKFRCYFETTLDSIDFGGGNKYKFTASGGKYTGAFDVWFDAGVLTIAYKDDKGWHNISVNGTVSSLSGISYNNTYSYLNFMGNTNILYKRVACCAYDGVASLYDNWNPLGTGVYVVYRGVFPSSANEFHVYDQYDFKKS